MNHLTESDWRKVDFDVLTHGYIRQRICVFGLKPSETPGNVVDLCRDFAAPQIFENEAADPVNQVSPEDEKESDRYKEEGNRHFQAKEFEDAIIKYTTAIRMSIEAQQHSFAFIHCIEILNRFTIYRLQRE